MRTLVFIFGLLASLTTTSAIANSTTNQEAIYCPESVTCTRAGDESSCTYKTDHPEIWEKNVSGNFGKNVTVGNHKLYRVWAYEHSRSFSIPNCMYPTVDTTSPNVGNMYVTVYPAKLANLEILDNAKWASSIINKAEGLGDCYTSDPKECPLSSHSVLIIHNANILDGLSISANGTHVLDKPIGQGQDVKILYDDVISGCGDADICKIDITPAHGGSYGYVYVDMTKHMGILSVYSWRPSEVILKQIDSFNAVDVSYASQLKK